MIALEFEIELNRRWLYDKNGDIIGETNFVVRNEWLQKIFDDHYTQDYHDLDAFLICYIPEIDGEYLYRRAKEESQLVEDLGVVMIE